VTTQADPHRDAPPEVIDLLNDCASLSDEDLRINVLSVAKSRQYSAALQASAGGDLLGLVALIDANDSNPYCYISRGPAKGTVIHYTHDGDPAIHCADLSGFRRALQAARDGGLDIDELPRHPLPRAGSDFIDAIAELAALDDDSSGFLLCLFTPLLPPDHVSTLDVLSRNTSFFVREALACFIAAHPLPSHHEIAARLAADPHPQVARPGRHALAAVHRASHRPRPDA
jgi:hypothetical protein